MNPEYTPAGIAMIVRCLRAQVEGPGPICPVCVHQAGLVAYEDGANTITAAGHVVLAIAAERDRERLRAEWQHATAQALRAFGDWTRAVTAGHKAEKEAGALDVAAQRRESTRAAYVAAGGTP